MQFVVPPFLLSQTSRKQQLRPPPCRKAAPPNKQESDPGRRHSDSGRTIKPRVRQKPVRPKKNSDEPVQVTYSQLEEPNPITDAAAAIAKADYLLIIVGESAASEKQPIPTSSSLVKNQVYKSAGLTDFSQMASADWLCYDPEIFFGFWAEYLNGVADAQPGNIQVLISGLAQRMLRRAPHAHRMLQEQLPKGEVLGEGPDAVRIVSVSADGLISRACEDLGLPEEIVYNARGDARRWQCSVPTRCPGRRSLFRIPSDFHIWVNRLTMRAPLYKGSVPGQQGASAAMPIAQKEDAVVAEETVAQEKEELHIEKPQGVSLETMRRLRTTVTSTHGGVPNTRAARALLAQSLRESQGTEKKEEGPTDEQIQELARAATGGQALRPEAREFYNYSNSLGSTMLLRSMYHGVQAMADDAATMTPPGEASQKALSSPLQRMAEARITCDDVEESRHIPDPKKQRYSEILRGPQPTPEVVQELTSSLTFSQSMYGSAEKIETLLRSGWVTASDTLFHGQTVPSTSGLSTGDTLSRTSFHGVNSTGAGSVNPSGFTSDGTVLAPHEFNALPEFSTTIGPASLNPLVAPPTAETQDNIPRCPFCGRVARPNMLLFGDKTFVPNAASCFDSWLEEVSTIVRDPFEFQTPRLVVLEIGVDSSFPYFRDLSERTVHSLSEAIDEGYDPFNNVTLVRVQHEHSLMALSGRYSAIDNATREEGPQYIPVPVLGHAYSSVLQQLADAVEDIDRDDPIAQAVVAEDVQQENAGFR